jgi:hypothetical protein
LLHAWNCFTRAVQLILPGHWFGPVARRAGPSPAHVGWAGPSPKNNKNNKKIEKIEK